MKENIDLEKMSEVVKKEEEKPSTKGFIKDILYGLFVLFVLPLSICFILKSFDLFPEPTEHQIQQEREFVAINKAMSEYNKSAMDYVGFKPFLGLGLLILLFITLAKHDNKIEEIENKAKDEKMKLLIEEGVKNALKEINEAKTTSK